MCQTPLWIRARESIISNINRTLSINMTWCIAYSFVYFALRRSVWRIMLVHFGGILRYNAFASAVKVLLMKNRPFILNFLRPSRNTITWSLIPHVLFLEITSVAVMRIPTAVINAYLTNVRRTFSHVFMLR